MSCCTGNIGCGCDSCRVAFSPYRGACTDPGSAEFASYLYGLDQQFCPVRVAGVGFVVSNLDGSGNIQIAPTTEPEVDLSAQVVAAEGVIGQIVVIGSDNIIRRLELPATANLWPQTNAAGQIFFGDPPDAVVPDPLAVNNLTVGVLATLGNVTISGSVSLSGISSDTLVTVLGLDGSNNLIKQAVGELTTQVAQFFESPTSPNAVYPNELKTASEYLVIGNRLFDSGLNIISVQDSLTLKCEVAGDYIFNWNGMIYNAGTLLSGIQLAINGITVSNGGVNPTLNSGIYQRSLSLACSFARSLAVGDLIQLQLAAGTTAGNRTYEVGMTITRVNA